MIGSIKKFVWILRKPWGVYNQECPSLRALKFEAAAFKIKNQDKQIEINITR